MKYSISLRTAMTVSFTAIALLCSTNGIAQTPTSKNDSHTVTIKSDNTVTSFNATINGNTVTKVKRFNANTALIQVGATVNCRLTQNCPTNPYVIKSTAVPFGSIGLPVQYLASGFNYHIHVSDNACGWYVLSHSNCSPCVGMTSFGALGPAYTVCVTNP